MQKYYIKIKRVKTGAMVTSVFVLFLLTFAFLFPRVDTPEGASAAGEESYKAPEITVETGHGSATAQLSVNNPNGTFNSSTEAQEAKFSISTNNYTGYSLYISGNNADGRLVDTLSGENYFSSISGITEADTFTSNADYNGKWGYRPSKYIVAGDTTETVVENTNGAFLPAPTDEIKLSKTTAANPSGASDSYTIGIGARANYTTNSGNYNNTLNLRVTANPINYSIIYVDDTGEGVVPDSQEGTTDTPQVTLVNRTREPRRSNYTFLGWCLYETVDGKGVSCMKDGVKQTLLHPGDTYDLSRVDSSTNSHTLHAVWSPNIALTMDESTPHLVTEITLGGYVCSSNNPDAYDGTRCIVEGLEYGETYAIAATGIATGYHISDWLLRETGKGSINLQKTEFTVGDGPNEITPVVDVNSSRVTFSYQDATTPGSSNIDVSYGTQYVVATPNPVKQAFTISGFDATAGNNADGAVVSSATSLTNNYALTGWWTNSGSGGNKIVEVDGQLMPGTAYTSALGAWTYNSDATFFAQWGDLTSVKLPTISKGTNNEYTCGWTTVSSGATTYEYTSGQDGVIPTSNFVLHGVCYRTPREVTVSFATGVNSVTFHADGYPDRTATPSSAKVSLAQGIQYTATPQLAEGYAVTGWELNNSSYGALDTSTTPVTFTPNQNSGSAVITVNAAESGPVYIHEFTNEMCAERASSSDYTVTDIRDNETYTVRYINGNCWMTKNLGFIGRSLNRTTSEVDASYTPDNPFTITWKSLGDESSIGYQKSESLHGTVYSRNAALISICPAGWRSPTEEQAQGISSYLEEFSPVAGLYASNIPSSDDYVRVNGYWWLSDSSTRALHYRIYSSHRTLGIDELTSGTKYGFYIRCVRDTYDVTVNLGEGVSSVTFIDPTYTEPTRVVTNGYKAHLTYGVTYEVTAAIKDGYTFDSWTLNNTDYATIGPSTGNPISFKLNQPTDSAILTINTNVGGTEYMQNLDKDLCTSVPITMKDSRDGQSYVIQRLQDGQCWMMTNLNLGATNLKVSQLDSTNTNFIGPNVSNVISATDFANWNRTISGTAYSYTEPKFTPAATDFKPYGTLYNYCALSAGTYCFNESSGTGDATSDICPAGWRIPMGGDASDDDSEYARLLSLYGDANMTAPITSGGLAFAFSGYFSTGDISSQGTSGAYSSSKISTSKNMYALQVSSSSIRIINNYDRRYGRSIRCVLQDTLKDIDYLQEVTPRLVAVTPENYEKELTDRRDNKTYSVKKFNGNIWMTENLKLTRSDLHPSDSNVAADTTVAWSSDNTTNAAPKYLAEENGGYFYNFIGATAGTEDLNYSVCSKNWRLPTDQEFRNVTSYKDIFSSNQAVKMYGFDGTWGAIDDGPAWHSSTPSGATGPDDAHNYWLKYYGDFLLVVNGTSNSTAINIRCIAEHL